MGPSKFSIQYRKVGSADRWLKLYDLGAETYDEAITRFDHFLDNCSLPKEETEFRLVELVEIVLKNQTLVSMHDAP